MNKITFKVAFSNSDFVGIESINNNMNITFPIGYDIEEKEIMASDQETLKKYQEDIMLLLKVLENNEKAIKFNNGNYTFNYTAGIYLINDFFQNGLVKSYSFLNSQINKGDINWPLTIMTKRPMYYQNNFFYDDMIYKSLKLENTDITKIQLFCLDKAFKILGIFYNNYQFNCNVNINLSKDEMLYKIRREMQKTNIDKECKRLSMMQKFIEGTDINSIGDKEIKIGTYYFNLIWESELRKKITFFYEELNILPNAYYMTHKEKKETSSLKPDIVVSSQRKIYLIDAKYYQIGFFPQTSDISKQLFYANYISQKNPKKKIKNIFLLPNKLSNEINYYGYATFDFYLENNGGKIHTYYLDTKKVLKGNLNIIECINELTNQ